MEIFLLGPGMKEYICDDSYDLESVLALLFRLAFIIGLQFSAFDLSRIKVRGERGTGVYEPDEINQS
jgi:uncharacterized membrane protein YciS (DUF1049 family)